MSKNFAKFLLFFVLTTSTKSDVVPLQTKIEGGGYLDNGLPYQVIIDVDTETDSWTCTGSIIAEYYVLTSAGCLFDPKSGVVVSADFVFVTAGLVDRTPTNGQGVQTSLADVLIVHDRYVHGLVGSLDDFDVALIQLQQKFYLDPRTGVDSVRLAEPGLVVKSQALISGWGGNESFVHNSNNEIFTKSDPNGDGQDGQDEGQVDQAEEQEDTLKGAYVDLITNDQCQELRAQLGINHPDLSDRLRCSYTEGVRVDDEDWGGPLTCFTGSGEEEFVQCGVVPYGHDEHQGVLTTKTVPSVYVNVQNGEIYDWIFANVFSDDGQDEVYRGQDADEEIDEVA